MECVFVLRKASFTPLKMNLHGRGVKWELGGFSRHSFEVAERRPKIAHGETVGLAAKKIQAPAGAAENKRTVLSVAPAGAFDFCATKPTADAVGYSLPRLRR